MARKRALCIAERVWQACPCILQPFPNSCPAPQRPWSSTELLLAELLWVPDLLCCPQTALLYLTHSCCKDLLWTGISRFTWVVHVKDIWMWECEPSKWVFRCGIHYYFYFFSPVAFRNEGLQLSAFSVPDVVCLLSKVSVALFLHTMWSTGDIVLVTVPSPWAQSTE